MKSILIIFCAALLSACGTIYKIPTQNNGTLPWATTSSIKSSDIEENTPHANLDELKFIVFLSGGNHKTKEFKEFSREAVDSMGFKNILTHTDYVRLIIEQGLEEKIEAKYDLISLHKAYKELGEFLVISMSSNWLGGSWFEMELRVTDPKTSEALLKARKESILWSDMDAEFSYPMVNLLNEWKNNSLSKKP